jgi:RNA polymerase sigma-54 factor
MKLHQVIAQRPTVTPQLVMARTLLQLSSTELELAISQELAENPALELVEIPGGEAPRCPKCGRALRGAACPSCERSKPQQYDAPLEYGGTDDRDDDGTPRLSSNTTLAEHLLRQVQLSLPPQDMLVATHLVESLDGHGFLNCDIDAVASQFDTDRTRVENVISTIQESGPVGIAAKDARECLLIQLKHLRSQGIEHPLAHALVGDHWEALSEQPLAKVASAAGATAEQVRAALEFIKDNLNPFPAHANWAALHESPPQQEAVYPQPDVIIRNGESPSQALGKYEIELPGARSYRLHISSSFREVMETSKAGKVAFTAQDVEEWKAFYARAQMFIKGVERRWQTLDRVAHHLIDLQRDFLTHGAKHLKPLTRAQLADMMNLHESTISRAVAGKYAQLPSGRIVPLAQFFDSAAPLKEVLRELIAQESQPLSDRQLVERLAQQGHHVARRTVAKYREALHIPPSSIRRRNRQLARKQPDIQT